jgi:hypothetical protein
MGPLETTVRNSPTTHNFTRLILDEAHKRDVVDAYYDCKIALDCLEERMDLALADDINT